MVEHPGDLVAVLGVDAHAALQDPAHRRRHRLVDLEPDGLAKPPPPELLLDRQHQIVGLVFLELEIGIARHPEEVRLVDRHAREEQVQVGGDDLLEQHEPARLDVDEAGQHGRHLDPGEALLLLVRVFHPDRHRQAQRADVGEGMAWIDRQGGQHGVDLVDEPLAEGGVVFRNVGVLDDLYPGVVQRRADLAEDVPLFQQQLAETLPDGRQLLGRGALARESPAPLSLLPAPSAPTRGSGRTHPCCWQRWPGT